MGFDQLHEQGRATFAALVPGGRQRLDEIFRTAPVLAEMAVGTVYGHPASRPRSRRPAPRGGDPRRDHRRRHARHPLAVHLRTALAAGLAPGEIIEVILQTAAFSGFPRAVASLAQVEQIFEQATVPVPPPPTPREIVLAAIDQSRQQNAHDPWTTCLDPDAQVTVYTVAADQAIAVVTPRDTTDAPQNGAARSD